MYFALASVISKSLDKSKLVLSVRMFPEGVEKFKNLYSRISYETQLSIQTANSLREYTSSMSNDLNISIHLDVSSEKAKAKTSKYSNNLINLVKAYDFPNVEVKPNSWAASSVADKYTKGFQSNA